MPKISVIVPCYNSSATIRRCIDSILLQTFSDIELIVTDDGSVDDTVKIIRDYRKYDSRIKLIKLEHSGPNMAREAGIKKASGEYIMFVDSDDYIAERAVETLTEAIKKYNVDFIRFNGIDMRDGKSILPVFEASENARVIGKQKIVELLLTTYKLNSLWLQIYKADKLKKIKAFHSNIVFGEDFLVNLELHQNTERMLILGGEPLYFYCDNLNSTTRSTDENKILSNISDRLYISNQAILYAQKNIEDINLKNKIIYSQIIMVKNMILKITKVNKFDKNKLKNDLRKILASKIFPEIDLHELRKYMRGLNLLRRLMNYRIVIAIITADCDYIIKYIKIYGTLKELLR